MPRRLAHFSDPRLDAQIGELIKHSNATRNAADKHAARRDNPHKVTAEQVGAPSIEDMQAVVDAHATATTGVHGVGASEVESKAGAQAKADAAEAAAKAYTDAHAETRAALDELGHVYHATLTATLDTDDWTGTEAPFAQSQEVSGILATDVPIVDVVLSGDWGVDEARLEAWGYIYRIVTSNDYITAYAREKPDVALPLQLKVVR